MRSTRSALLGLLLTALLAVFTGCGFPAPEACELACGAEGACPGGFACQAETNHCVPRGWPASCSLRDKSPDPASEPAPDTDAGNGGVNAGGAGPGGAGPGGAGGAASPSAPDSGVAGSNTAGASGRGGEPNEPGPGTLVIIDEPSSESACTGLELSRALSAGGGTGPYSWRLLEAPTGIELSRASGGTVLLVGRTGEPGAVRVELEDAAGQIARAEVAFVHQVPEIETLSLPAYCAGGSYAAELVAGGGVGDYTWSAELIPSAGQPSTLAELGLDVSGSALRGELAGADEAQGPFRLLLSARDAHCASEEVELELDVEPADSPSCPSILVDDWAFDELPPACRGAEYDAGLQADGGEPPYTWTELSAPPGLYLDAGSATIGGVPTGDGVLTVALTDGLMRTVRKSFAVEAREACWLAYVASEPFPARLELVDGRLLDRQRGVARRTLPPEASADPVQDFEFSPDGRFIAYRLGVDALRLELSRLSDGLGRELDFAGSIAAYTWSEDGSLLVVVLVDGGAVSLGGFDVVTQRALLPRSIPSIDSPLLGLASGRVAYLSRDPLTASRRRLVTLTRSADGFEAASVHLETTFSDAARLRAGAGGVFVAEPETGSHHYFRGDGTPPVTHGEDVVLAANGDWVGVARSGALQLFRAGDASGPAATPFLSAPGCTALLSWASASDRIACVDARGGQTSLVPFEVLSGAAPSLVDRGSLVVPELGPAGAHVGRRRAVSAAGRWFAFANDEAAHVTRLDGARPELALVLPNTALGSRPGVMLFSPDQSSLLIGAGNTLGALGLSPAAELKVLSASAVFDEGCSEQGAGSGWCGSESGVPDLAWSPGSDLVTFRSALGTLQLVDMSAAREGFVPPPLSPDAACSEACRSAQTARFQP